MHACTVFQHSIKLVADRDRDGQVLLEWRAPIKVLSRLAWEALGQP